jgi:hypothetical protein
MYQRLNLNKKIDINRLPIWERIDLTRPVKLKCLSCRLKIQPNWRICPQCGSILSEGKPKQPHCIWVNACWEDVDAQTELMLLHILEDVFAKVFSAFRSINVFLTSELPDFQQWGDRFTHVGLIIDREPVDYLGVASFQKGQVTSRAIVRLDQILNTSEHASLSSGQLSNLIANTIAHEIAHTLGLGHSELSADVMNDGLNHRIHSLMPPSFHAEQITQMNYAIYQRQLSFPKHPLAPKTPRQK